MSTYLVHGCWTWGFKSPLGHQIFAPRCVLKSTAARTVCVFGLVGQPETELPVDVGRVGVAEHGGDVAERVHQGCDFCSAHPARGGARVCGEVCFRAGAFSLGLRDPAGDHRRVGSGVEGGAVKPSAIRLAAIPSGPVTCGYSSL
ncbi:hypothetical protein OHA01_02295 [Micromonospora zamorensis]|uniref:hypothetical protein n=1 Tax=Micromonospora zamorensis TaxID=709883 RepID=UPI00386D68BB|nr:hypothetical protein OHA01_02295 [Micromonospora zamorensis]